MPSKAIAGFLLVLLAAFPVSARELGGVSFSETIETEKGLLVLNGVGRRTVFTRTVYLAGLYLREAGKNGREIASVDEPMAIRICVVDDFLVTSARLQDAVAKGFRRSMPHGDTSPLKSRIQRFTACFAGDVQTGDRFEIRYLPGQGTRVRKNGEQKAEIGGLAFKRAVFGIWIGEDPVQQSLKEQMLAGRTAEGANRELLRERFVSEDIYFSSGAGRLSGPAKRKLADKAAFLLKYPQVRVVIEGHSDSRGPSEVNYRIARERARQVKKYLVAAGVAAKRLEVISYGEEKPASKGSPAGNRRVHLRIVDAAPENSASDK